jgi:methanogenic corrinoid protein MtbC1
MDKIVERFKEALLSTDEEKAAAIMTETEERFQPGTFLEKVLIPALDDIGTGWEQGEFALSQVYMSGRICEELVDQLLPAESAELKEEPKMALVLLNDYHALGKKIVYSVLRAGGYNVADYGRMQPDELLEKLEEEDLELVLISVLMYSSALQIKQVVQELAKSKLRTRVAVGGAPFRLDRQLWQEVGAHAVGYTATDALNIAKSFSGGVREWL